MNKLLSEHAARMRLRTINDRLSALERAVRKKGDPAAHTIAEQNLKQFWEQVTIDREFLRDARIFRQPNREQRAKRTKRARQRREELRRDRATAAATPRPAELPTLYPVDYLEPA